LSAVFQQINTLAGFFLTRAASTSPITTSICPT
jgi:hypothetical protein